MSDDLAREAIEAAYDGPPEKLKKILGKIERAVGDGESQLDCLEGDLIATKIYPRNIVGMGGRLGRAPKTASAHFYAMVAAPMIAAAGGGQMEALSLLMEFSDRTGILTGSLHLALAAACMAGHGVCARVLIEAGARFDMEDRQGRAALHLAAMGGHTGCVAELIAAGADARAKDEDQQCPLMFAMKRGFADCAEILMPFSGPIAVAKDGVGIAHWAAEGGHPKCLALALEAYPELAATVDDFGVTPLMLAAAAGNPESVKILLPLSDVAAKDGNERTALWMAARHGPSCVPLLIPGSDLEARDDDMGETALSSAIAWGYGEAVQELLTAGANPMARDSAKKTCLHVAARSGPEMVELLLPVSDPRARDAEGRTPLIYAVSLDGGLGAEAKIEEMARMLLPVSDPDARDDKGRTAAEAARNKNNHAIAALIDGLVLSAKESQEMGEAARKDGVPSKASMRV